MKQNNSEILQLFARKLSICRHKISAEKLAQYLKNGEFGFSFLEEWDRLVTNDTVFAAEVEQLVSHIRSIFIEPHISLRKDGIISNVSIASKMDTRSINATYRDERLWRVKHNNGVEEKAPEFIYTYVYEDELAIYENRFVCYLIDDVLKTISRRLKALSAGIQTLNRKIDSNIPKIAYSSDVYVKYTDTVEPRPLLSSLKDPTICAIQSLLKSKNVLTALTGHELYTTCKRAGVFHIRTLRPTNLLMNDADYNFCYRFCTSYFHESRYIASESSKYINFTLVEIFLALMEEGYTLSSDSQDVIIGEDAQIRLQNLVFEKDLFRIGISQSNTAEFIFDVSEIADNSSAKYLFKIVFPEELENRSLEEYAKELDRNRAEGIARVFLICDQYSVSDQIVTVIAGEPDVGRNLREAIRSITIVAEGVSFLHKKYCPVCGSTYLAPENNDYTCAACNTVYHMFTYEFHDLIWMKRLPDIVERRAKTGEPIATKDDAVTAMAPQEQATKKVILKSFEGRLSQSTQEQKAYYTELKNYLCSFKRIHARLHWNYDSFYLGRDVVFRIAFRGRTMVAYLALDPKDYLDTKYFARDMSEKKKFEKTPVMVKVKSARGVRYAKELIDVICKDLEKRKNYVDQTYDLPTMSDSELLEKGLLKETFVKV